MKNRVIVCTMFLVLLGCGAASAEPIVLNPSFEMPDVPAGSFVQNPGGAVWNLTSFSGIADVGGLGLVSPPDGTQAAYIRASSTMFQVINGFDEGPYTVSFYAAGSPTLGTRPIGVSFGGGGIGDSLSLTFNGAGSITPPVGSFVLYTSDPFTINPGTQSLTFVGTTVGIGPTAFIDSVSIQTVVPEPPSFWLLGGCLVGLFGVVWLRRLGQRAAALSSL